MRRYEREVEKTLTGALSILENRLFKKLKTKTEGMRNQIGPDIPDRFQMDQGEAEGRELDQAVRLVIEQFQRDFNLAWISGEVGEVLSRMAEQAPEQFTEADMDMLGETIRLVPSSGEQALMRENAQILAESFRQTINEIGEQTNFIAFLTGRDDDPDYDFNEAIKTLDDELKAQLDKMMKRANYRLKFAARNSTSRTLGKIQMERQKEAGIDLYIWQTAEDERVRDTHEDLGSATQAGIVGLYSWNESGTTYKGERVEPARDPDFNGGAATFPGEPWNCRCVAAAFLPELMDDDDE